LEKIIRVVCAIENAYYAPLWQDKETDDFDLHSLTFRNLETNELQSITKGWTKCTLEEIQRNITIISEEELRE